jgi:hypothetical protein
MFLETAESEAVAGCTCAGVEAFQKKERNDFVCKNWRWGFIGKAITALRLVAAQPLTQQNLPAERIRRPYARSCSVPSLTALAAQFVGTYLVIKRTLAGPEALCNFPARMPSNIQSGL